jgi:hypothetical protein
MEMEATFRRLWQSTVILLACLSGVHAQGNQCRVVANTSFPGDGEIVRLARQQGLPAESNMALFRAPLAVNTDGAPNSYHPRDPLGENLAINRFDNGISIRKQGSTKKLPLNERLTVFARWRDSGFNVPTGYRINWKNVIAPDAAGKPCVFKTGANTGYFGSLTALKNGLTGQAVGECEASNQLDQRFIPAIVLRGAEANPLWSHGARVGDLVVAINPATGVTVAAVIGDSGDGNRIGEGSVALNMALLGQSKQPSNYADASSRLDTGNRQMIVAVLPRSRTFQPVRPFTVDNIRSRVEAWAVARGYASTAGLSQAVRLCADGL